MMYERQEPFPKSIYSGASEDLVKRPLVRKKVDGIMGGLFLNVENPLNVNER